ncbi:glycosyltransferase [Arcticibacter sp.]|uniref:glycosyltransferase n=1 Tax=Arcticibacter sp. TaxID=1872630 RepID=UPI00388DDAFF
MRTKVFLAINSLQGGGAERVIVNLGNHFHKQGLEVVVVCLNAAEQAYSLDSNIKLITLLRRNSRTDILARIWFAAVTFVKFVYFLIKERPRCVISFTTSVNIWTGISCILCRVPYVVSERTTPDHTVNTFGLFTSFISYVAYSRALAIVVPSGGMIGSFKKNRMFRKLNNYKIINNPINQFGHATTDRVYDRKFILSVGRLDYVKGFDVLIDVYSKMDLKDVDLIISGEGSEREKLLKQIHDLKMEDHIKLVGFKSNLQDYYTQAELFVLSSRNEGYPNALIEAMSLGCPCVSVDCQYGPSEIIKNNWNGLLIENNNPELLSTSILKILQDTSLRTRLSQNCRSINIANSPERISSSWKTLIPE